MKMKSIYFVAGLLLMIIQGSWQNPLQDTEEKSRQPALDERENEKFLDQLSSNGLSRRHAEFERHAEGTYTSDITSYLEGQAAKEFIAWLVNGRGRRDFSEEANAVEELDRRHADGTFTSDINKILDDMAAKEFLKWLINTKVTQRDLLGEYQ
ncbi:pro-glucagon isoform X2 [Chrysemys picta bellii]|uniref:pro-glucagon isoform X2 n=1 Tax=Chrysemys picta bellii TaxID=8478 RepID=UPI001C677F25|nr:pro-glucagon isoform X2 [Chrysemys picta bellii]